MPKVMAVDSGLANIGVAIMHWTGTEWVPTSLLTLNSKPTDRLLEVRMSSDLARRVAEQTRALGAVIKEHGIKHLVGEIPNAGAMSADALRSMMLGLGLLVSTAESAGLITEYYDPGATRAAAGVPRSVRKGVEVKKIVMANMAKIYPALSTLRLIAEREHAADALATFEAAKSGNLVRSLQL